MNWLGLILRWFHLVAAITAVGGTIFMRFALLPSVQSLADDARKSLHEQVRSRWAKVVMACIAFLLISGLTNYILFILEMKTPPWADWKSSFGSMYHMVFGIKFLAALAIFFIASALVGRSAALKPIRDNAKTWMTINVVLALQNVQLSSVLQITHTGPTFPKATTTETASTGDSHG